MGRTEASQRVVAALMAASVSQITAAMSLVCALERPWWFAQLSPLQRPAVRWSSCSVRILAGWRWFLQCQGVRDRRGYLPIRCSLAQIKEFVGFTWAVDEPALDRGPVNSVGARMLALPSCSEEISLLKSGYVHIAERNPVTRPTNQRCGRLNGSAGSILFLVCVSHLVVGFQGLGWIIQQLSDGLLDVLSGFAVGLPGVAQQGSRGL